MLGSELVTIHVGSKRKPFSVHKKHLCDRSPYFARAFTRNFKEKAGVTDLPDEDPRTFELLINYIYQDTVPAFRSEVRNFNVQSPSYECLIVCHANKVPKQRFEGLTACYS
jgi:hypothetical protein